MVRKPNAERTVAGTSNQTLCNRAAKSRIEENPAALGIGFRTQLGMVRLSPCLTLFSSEASLSRGKDRQFLKILVTNKSWIFLVILPWSIDLDLIVRRFALHSDRDRSCIYA